MLFPFYFIIIQLQIYSTELYYEFSIHHVSSSGSSSIHLSVFSSQLLQSRFMLQSVLPGWVSLGSSRLNFSTIMDSNNNTSHFLRAELFLIFFCLLSPLRPSTLLRLPFPSVPSIMTEFGTNSFVSREEEWEERSWQYWEWIWSILECCNWNEHDN